MFKTNEEVKNIVKLLPDNETLANEILLFLGNNTTKIQKDKDIKNSYYVYLKDTIYLADNKENNEGENRLCLIAHECRHSMQSKVIQKINFILSNIQIFISIILIILEFFIKSDIIIYGYILFSVISIMPRVILEIDAVLCSTKIAGEYLITKVSKQDSFIVERSYKKKTRLLLPLYILSFFSWRIICTILLFIIYLLK